MAKENRDCATSVREALPLRSREGGEEEKGVKGGKGRKGNDEEENYHCQSKMGESTVCVKNCYVIGKTVMFSRKK